MASLTVTPPIPRPYGLVEGTPGAPLVIQQFVNISWQTMRTVFLDANGFYRFPAATKTVYRVLVDGDSIKGVSPEKRIFNEPFTTRRPVWQDRLGGEPSCATVEGGELVLRVIQNPNGSFSTGHIATGEIGGPQRFAMSYGWASARMKFHWPQGAHAGFWMQSSIGYAENEAEVDVVEFFGKDNPPWPKGRNAVQTVWWNGGDRWNLKHKAIATNELTVKKNWTDSYNDFTVHWTPDYYEFWINGKMTGRITEAVTPTEKFLLLSILVRDWEKDELEANLAGGTPISEYEARCSRVACWQSVS